MEKTHEAPTRALTFDDVLIVPAYSEVLPADADLQTQLTRSIPLNVPLVSSAMDTVTEADLAIALAQEGGIGFVHKNMSPEKQAEQVMRVKRYESGVIKDPITVAPNTSIRQVIELTEQHKISGVPVVDANKLCGIVTHRDIRFETHLDEPVSTVMTPRERLVTVPEGTERETVQALLHKHRIEKVLMVNDSDSFELRGMITAKDFQKSRDYPKANKDAQGRLRVGAAVGVSEQGLERVEALLQVEIDVVLVDTAHGHSKLVLQTIRNIKKQYPDLEIIAGNVVSSEGAKALLDCGVDGVKVGIGPGSICTTRIIAGTGVPQITAIQDVAQALKGSGVPIIADGGVRFSGDIAKAIVAGAHTVMIGGLFAGTLEAPGEVELYQGRSYKVYRGMGTIAAMQQGSSDRYFQHRGLASGKFVPEGIEGRVPYRGSVADVVFQLLGGVRASMGYTGCQNIEVMRTKPQLIQITDAGMKESHPHNVSITKQAPNYQTDD